MLGRLQREVQGIPAGAALGSAVRKHVMEMAELALMFRASKLDDAHDHRLLHPARTLILFLEAGGAEPEPLTVAPLLESRFPELTPSRPHWPGGRGPRKATLTELLQEIPRPSWWCEPRQGEQHEEAGPPSGEQELASGSGVRGRGQGRDAAEDAILLEDLVALPPEHLRLALCEVLDQLRHLHVEPGRPALARGVELARKVYTPLAVRLAKGGRDDPGAALLARRFHRWQERLARVTGT